MKKAHFIFYFLVAVSLALQGNDSKTLLENVKPGNYPGAHLAVVFDSTISDVSPSGLSYVHMHSLYKVFDTKGALQFNTVKVDYDPLSAYVEIRKVVIHRADGTTEELDTGKVMDYPQPARAIYWGARSKMIEVGRLKPGDGLEVWMFRKGFTYALLYDQDDDSKYIPPMKGHFYDIIEFWSDDPIIEKVYRVKVPKDKNVQYQVYNGSLQSSAWMEDDKMVYTFTGTGISPLKREPWQVALSDVATKLLISSSPDWYAKSVWFYGVNEDYGSFEFTPEVKEKVDEILQGAYSEMDSVSLLTHWVADEVRYSGISMGCGEGYTLHKGEMTFTDRCGVCKDKAGMLVTMLRAAGFESYAAMTMAGSRIDYIPADQFNHSVTVVKLSDGKYHLLDPTWVPFVRELWSSAEQQQQYLMGLPEGADLATTPVSPPEDHFIRIYGNSELDQNGNLTGEFTIRAEGQTDAAIRRMFTSHYKHLWDESIENELKSVHPNARITQTEYLDPYNYKVGPIRIHVEYEIPSYALVTDEEVIVKSFIASGIFKRAMSHLYQNTGLEERQYPFRDRCSRYVKFNETIKLPGEFDLLTSAEEETFADSTAAFEGAFSVSGSGQTLRMNMDAAFGKRIYRADEWQSYKRAVESHKAFMEEPVILVRREKTEE